MMKNKILLLLTAVSCSLAQGMDGREASPQAAASPKAQRMLGGHGIPVSEFDPYKTSTKRVINSLRGTNNKLKSEIAEKNMQLAVLQERLAASEREKDLYKTQLEALQLQVAESQKRNSDKDSEQAKVLKALVTEVKATRAASVEQEGRLLRLIRESMARPGDSMLRTDEAETRAGSVMSTTSVVSFAPSVADPSTGKPTRKPKAKVVSED